MREIEFRMWSKEYQEMYGVEVLRGMYQCMAELAIENVDEVKESRVEMPLTGIALPFQDDAVLMQYTGIKDKNGVKIFEGDIVKMLNGKIRIVAYYNEYVRFGLFEKSDKNKYKLPIIITDLNTCEVIGNIYKNPELLEARKLGTK